ncbi:MPP2 [Branchiostoma lanceolatum]|uniref:MPP2 protein n=1 Tax=Branchiostoma lanceolatum TaxID=7740 RepID=A0A8K0EIB1_BRALA|nr:MPP2 [Branchiostoma lanceolatum]
MSLLTKEESRHLLESTDTLPLDEAQTNQAAEEEAAVQAVLDNMEDLGSAGAKDTDLIFLKGLMDSPVMKSLVRDLTNTPPPEDPLAHDRLEEQKLEPVREENLKLVDEIVTDLNPVIAGSNDAAELSGLLNEPHFKALLEAHDAVAAKSYETPPPSPVQLSSPPPPAYNGMAPGDAIRMVGIRKSEGEPLGVTLKVENGELVIARIMHGGMIDRQGLLHVGDIIKEINGKDVSNSPEALQDYLKNATGSITLKILPSYQENLPATQVYVKSHFDYDPVKDNLIPCKEAGLAFQKGDVLQIVNQDDTNWWQAANAENNGPAGLIPSQVLEERRKAFVKPEYDYVERPSGILGCGPLAKQKKKKMMYLSDKNAEFDRHELSIYEEVAKMPPFQRKTLILIGAQGVGRRSLKNRLILSDHERFGTTMPLPVLYEGVSISVPPASHSETSFRTQQSKEQKNGFYFHYTSRAPREGEEDGKGYYFADKTAMQADIRDHKYLESGEYEGNLYGTKLDSVRNVMRSGKMCILDVNPQALKVLKTPEFMPFVVFIAAPSVETLKEMHEQARAEGATTKTLTPHPTKKAPEFKFEEWREEKSQEKEKAPVAKLKKEEDEGANHEEEKTMGNLIQRAQKEINEDRQSYIEKKVLEKEGTPTPDKGEPSNLIQRARLERQQSGSSHRAVTTATETRAEPIPLHYQTGLGRKVQEWELDNDLKRTVEESARLERAYGHFFDLQITNDNLDVCYDKLQSAVDGLSTEPQWVPVTWVY